MATTKLKGNLINLGGTEVNVNSLAPNVKVVGEELKDIEIGGKKEKVQILISVPSLDTPLCAAETRKFNEEASQLQDVEASVISMDLPFAAYRFCTTEGIDTLNVTSDFRAKEFANAYGVLMIDGKLQGLTCRAIFVINKEGIITYKEICEDITDHPNYEAALNAIKEAK